MIQQAITILVELIKKAKTHVNMRIGFLFEEEIQQLKNILKKYEN